MATIKLLPDTVINQIAAGEVIDRPASVVRELVDNGLDAGATNIQVRLLDGGRTLIRVIDDGRGMVREDALLAFERHATSKLTKFSDLLSLHTKGFRGEALASISSVARMRLLTRRREDATGTEVLFAGGRLNGVNPQAAPVGTDLEVRNIFFNTPARRKFLKSDKVENSRVRDLVAHYALCHPSVSFQLYIDEKLVASHAQVSSRKERGKSFVRGNSVSVEQRYDEILVEGVLGHPSAASAEAQSCVVIINDRIVTDKIVLRAVKEGFSSTLKDREFPVGYLSLTLPQENVDINVHPQKSEVRFSFPQKIFTAVKTAVTEAIHDFRAPVAPEWTHLSSPTSGVVAARDPEYAFEPQRFAFNQSLTLAPRFEPADQPALSEEYSGRYQDLAYIGQLFECYLLCQHSEHFYIVDMHAAHERINFNRIKAAMNSGPAKTQALLMPLTVELGVLGLEQILEQRDMLGRCGFELEAFSDDTVIVRGVPALLQEGDIESTIRELSMVEVTDDSPGALATRLDYVAARIACHASVRSGRSLKRDEVYALFAAMDDASFAGACPHGRPCIVTFSEADVERWFGRDR